MLLGTAVLRAMLPIAREGLLTLPITVCWRPNDARTYHVHRLLHYSCWTEHVIAVRWISKGQGGIWCDEQLGPLVHLQKHPVKSLDSSSKCLLLQILSAISLSGLVQHSRSAAKVALPFHLISLFRIPRSGRSHANLIVNKQARPKGGREGQPPRAPETGGPHIGTCEPSTLSKINCWRRHGSVSASPVSTEKKGEALSPLGTGPWAVIFWRWRKMDWVVVGHTKLARDRTISTGIGVWWFQKNI
jgi:hypothetical protein